MTCLLNTYGRIQNLENLIDYLNEPLITKNSSDTYPSEENDDWDWKDQKELVSTESDNSRMTENWLDSFLISISPCGNLIVVASETRIVLCIGKWSINNEAVFSASHRFDFKRDTSKEEKEKITAVCVVPIASQRKSGEGLLDWTCILVGSSTGKLRMYTENGTLLNTQIFHTGEILKIKCRTYEPAKYIGWIQQPEEIELLYTNNVLVCIDGCNMYHYFRMARKYVASGHDDYNEINELISSLSLDFKIWHLNNQDCLADFVSAGLTSENRFDQLFAASMIGGPDEKFESIPPISNRYLTCGGPPYLSFFYTIEGLSIPVFTEVKQAAGKVTSALMNVAKGWIGFGRSNETSKKEVKPKIEPPTLLPSRFALNDLRRKGETVIIAPANNLAAITDSYARVILVDVLKGVAVRIFKGYRDAQIGWICVDDETEDKNNKRYALYLIIYAPRRGLLEIWGCQQGIRVAAFNVGKNSKLIYPGYYMLTLNGSLANDQPKTNHKIQCFLLNEEGAIKNVQIPFHLILSDKSNQRVRDTILLKKLKSFLRSENKETSQLWHSIHVMLKEFKTASIKQQALDRIVTTKYLSPIKIYETLNEEVKTIQGLGLNQSSDSLKLGSFCKLNCKLIYSYMFVNEFNATSDNLNEVEDLCELLQVDEVSLKNYFDFRQRYEKSAEHKSDNDSERESLSLDLTKYLQCFELSNATFLEVDTNHKLNLNKNISLKSKKALGGFYFGKLLSVNINYNVEEFLSIIELIPLKKIDLLNLVVAAWIGNYYKNISFMYKLVLELTGFTSFLKYISTESTNEKIDSSEENTDLDGTESEVKQTCESVDEFENLFINEYISRFRTICENTSINYMTSSLMVIWIFRSVLIQSNQLQNQIDMLTGLSERTFMLIKFHFLLLTGTKQIETASITLKSTFSKGKGVLSEIVAKHIVLNEFPPKILTFITPTLKLSDTPEDDQENQSEMNIDNNPNILLKDKTLKKFYDLLQETREYLPRSLEPDILLSNSAWEAMIAANNKLELDISGLEISLRYIGEIGNAILKQGVLSMIWHQYILKRVSSLTAIIDKVGKTPKDRQLRKEVGLNEQNVLKFIECVLTVLDLIMDANCNINEVPIFMHDKFWNDHSEFDNVATASFLSLNSIYYDEAGSKQDTNYSLPITANPKQLVELAAEQKHVNYSLCLFHSQLIRILYLIVRYNMKLVRPLAFFDTKGKHTLFSELHTHPLISNDVDIKIMNLRKQFFTKTMNSIMETVDLPVTTKSKLPKDIDECFSTIFNLSKDMGVDLEFVKGFYCCMLYALDYHNEAEKVLRTIKEIEQVAYQLLVVVGCKINEILSLNFDANLVSILSTNLTAWLKSLGSSDYRIYTLPSKQPILELIGNVIMKLSDSAAEHRIAVELFDFIENPEFQF